MGFQFFLYIFLIFLYKPDIYWILLLSKTQLIENTYQKSQNLLNFFEISLPRGSIRLGCVNYSI
jgi:hypothetical protein